MQETAADETEAELETRVHHPPPSRLPAARAVSVGSLVFPVYVGFFDLVVSHVQLRPDCLWRGTGRNRDPISQVYIPNATMSSPD